MPCNPLLKEAFNGIEFEYKLDRVVAELPSTIKFDSNDMYKYLQKKGVSPKEIEASGIMDMYEGDYKFSAKDWQEDFKHTGKLSETRVDGGYDDITLGKQGQDNHTYKETLTQIPNTKAGNPAKLRHYEDYNTGPRTNLGWRRTHVDNINGKDTTVLNEFQSDWAQYERDGYGTFESTSKSIDNSNENRARLIKELNSLDKNDESLFYRIKDLKEEIKRIADKNMGDLDIVNDFPMAEKKFSQLQIVKAINESLKNGTNRIAIPIERENELVGKEGVTKFYDNLSKSILPDIKKKLEKQGLRIKLSKEPYSQPIKYTNNAEEYITNNILDTMGSEWWDKNSKVIGEDIQKAISGEEPTTRYVKDAIEFLGKEIQSKGANNTLHIIEIEEIPGTKVRWDMYGIMSALGLEEATKENKDGL